MLNADHGVYVLIDHVVGDRCAGLLHSGFGIDAEFHRRPAGLADCRKVRTNSFHDCIPQPVRGGSRTGEEADLGEREHNGRARPMPPTGADITGQAVSLRNGLRADLTPDLTPDALSATFRSPYTKSDTSWIGGNREPFEA